MADTYCFVCSLPFSGEKARFVKGKPVCPQCQDVVGAAHDVLLKDQYLPKAIISLSED
jgi:hypothetical protein